MAESAIVINDVSKRFRLYHEKYSSLKERVIHFGKVPYEEYWALSDVNLEIYSGETIGLLGHNGSGKSTLLKCVAAILQPTTGEIRTRGRLAALLELGAGLHPDLTGRENVFLNASLLGLSRKSVEKKFDEIVAFAELEQFIDNQVKYYSSGMYVRLGFAVAVNMDPEILLVDEVLAVGDELFQRKCLDRVRQFQREGRTIVVVTHAADMVRQICDRAAVLDHGRLVAVGTPGEAVRSYREHLLQRNSYDEAEISAPAGIDDEVSDAADGSITISTSSEESSQEGGAESERSGDEAHGLQPEVAEPVQIDQAKSQEEKRNLQVKVTTVEISHNEQSEREYLLPGEGMRLAVNFESYMNSDNVVFGVAVYDLDGLHLFGANTDLLDIDLSVSVGPGTILFDFESVPLLDGDYLITVGVHSHDEATVYDWHEQQYRFSVMNPTRTVGTVHVPVTIRLEQPQSQQLSG